MARYSTVQEFIDTAGPLTGAETRLLEAVRTGEPCFLPTGDPADVTLPKAADDTVTIRADFLRILILGGSAECGLDGVGVRLFGAWIDGRLDLGFSTARGLNRMDSCHFTDTPIFYQAHLKLLALDNSHLPGLMAQAMQVEGDVFLREITATGTVAVNGVRIGGQLACVGATLDGGKDSSGTTLPALNAQGLEVAQDLFLCPITAKGTVDLAGAKIGGQLSFLGATLNGDKDSKGTSLRAIRAVGIAVGRDLFLNQITAIGAVDLTGARIGGQLNCQEATLDGGLGWALSAQRVHVEQGIIFREVKQTSGGVNLTAAYVSDLVDDIRSWPICEDQLILDGFAYDRTYGPTTFDARKDWLRAGSHWQGEFRPQPYAQFARVLRGMGHEREARRVLIAGKAEQAKARMGFRRQSRNGLRWQVVKDSTALAGMWVKDVGLRWLTGYGYAMWRLAVLIIAILWLSLSALSHFAWKEGSFAPNSDVILLSEEWLDLLARDCIEANGRPPKDDCILNPASEWSSKANVGMDWDSFNAFGYAADVVVPLLELGQEASWAPSKDRGDLGWWLWWLRWVFTFLGWSAVSYGVATIAPVILPKRVE